MARRRRVEAQIIRGDEWRVTFSHTMTVLLILFIMMFSFSTINNKRLMAITTTVQSTLKGDDSSGVKQNSTSVETSKDKELAELNINDIYIKAQTFIDENKLGTSVEVMRDTRGVILKLRDSSLFDSENAELIPDSKNLLKKLGSLLTSIPNNIVVEGHTDNVPINTYKFQSNWDLSAERAVSVVKFFIDEENLNPTRFTASGFGEYRPIVDNSTPENRAKNRRVNILIVAEEREKK